MRSGHGKRSISGVRNRKGSTIANNYCGVVRLESRCIRNTRGVGEVSRSTCVKEPLAADVVVSGGVLPVQSSEETR